ncbi:hypothetical protein OPV22_000727 [Ensete ventricosum]|uniref:Uncharacterized protein n=1 Tax=Ensete ventricosum TaxID=4639 RepID=A0AAV8RTN1_ENSVE|nr:hypothetical protein OPV22_000727 [Ensete ventricosum]
MKDLFKTKVHKGDVGYYALLMSDLGHQDPEKEMKARWKGLKNSMKVWNNLSTAEEFERGLLHPQLARELYTLPSEVLMGQAAKEMVLLQEELDTLKSRGGPEAVAEAEERTSELREELKKIKREKVEELLRREASEKELQEVRGHLGDAQQLLREARTRARRMDDELLQAVKDLESNSRVAKAIGPPVQGVTQLQRGLEEDESGNIRIWHPPLHCCQRISHISDSIDDPVGAFPVRGQLATGPDRVADLSLSEHQVARCNVPRAYLTIVQLCDDPSIGQCLEMGISSLFL